MPEFDSSYALNYHWNATSRLGFDLGAKIQEVDYTGSDDFAGTAPSRRADRMYTIAPGATYAFTPQLSASLSYTYNAANNELYTLRPQTMQPTATTSIMWFRWGYSTNSDIAMHPPKEKIVVVGNGMAGARVVEEILKRAPGRFDITMFGAEPYGNYNRILLSNVLNGSQAAAEIFMNPLAWYTRNGIRLHAGVKATFIDRRRKMVIGALLKKEASAYAVDAATADAAHVEETYDHVIIATGSRPFVPPMEGFGVPGTFLFRTLDDCDQIASYAKTRKKATVIGGGLLGLEAARGLMTHGVKSLFWKPRRS